MVVLAAGLTILTEVAVYVVISDKKTTVYPEKQ